MKSTPRLSFLLILGAAFMLLASASEALAQRSSNDIGSTSTFGGNRSSRDTSPLPTFDDELNAMRNQGDLDPSTQRKIFIIEDIKRMDDASGKLLDTLKKQEKDYLKEAGKLAEKIAKASNSLRNRLTPKGKPEKVEAAMPIPEGEILERLRRQANAMDEIVLNVIDAKPAAVKKDDTARLEQICKQLAEVEKQALGIREVTRSEK